jgi:opacity protein-like surface antigen
MLRLFAFLLLATVLLWAERAGPYVGIGVGLAGYDDDGRLASVENRSQEAFRIYAGAYINENFSVEVDYNAVMEFDGVLKNGGEVTEKFSFLSTAVVLHYPVANDTTDLFVKFGASEVFWRERGSESHKDSAAAMLLGLGVGYRLKEYLTLNLGYDAYFFSMDISERDSYDMLLGAAYLKIEVQF